LVVPTVFESATGPKSVRIRIATELERELRFPAEVVIIVAFSPVYAIRRIEQGRIEMTNDSAADQVAIEPMQMVRAMERRTSGSRYLHFQPECVLFQKGFDICLHLLFELGEVEPRDSKDSAQRDLACDVLDSLRIADYALLQGYENQGLVLLRRAFETISLMVYFVNFPHEVQTWESGKEIWNSVIRNALDTAALPEPKDHLKDLYGLYCDFSHVNRKTVWHRLLGEDNHFTIGAQGNVDDKTVGAYLRELLRMMMWFVDVLNFVFAAVATSLGPEYVSQCLAYRSEVQKMADHLAQL
jgi:hypothetical protein